MAGAFQSDAFQNSAFQTDSQSATYAFAQAQALIIGLGQKFAQAQAFIDPKRKFAQAQAYIFPNIDFIRQIYLNNPYAWYPLDETSGSTAVNKMGTGNGTITGSFTKGVSVPLPNDAINRAITGTGNADQSIVAAISQITNTFSLEVWVKPNKTILLGAESNAGINAGTSDTQNYIFFPEQKASDRGLGLSVGTNGIVVAIHGNSTLGSIATYTGSISNTAMHHVVVTLNNKVPIVYLDGVLVRNGITATASLVYSPLTMGGYQSAPNHTYGPFNGVMNNAIIYNSVLSSTDVANHYNAGLPHAFAQAAAFIDSQPRAYAQVQALIDDRKPHAQAQAYILAIGINKSAQANAAIARKTIVNSTYEQVTDHSSFTRSFGFTPTAGNILVAQITIAAAPDPASATGWTRLLYENPPFNFATTFLAKVSDGTETSVNFNLGNNNQFVWSVVELQNVGLYPEILTSTYSAGGNFSLPAISTAKDSLILGYQMATGSSTSYPIWSTPFHIDYQGINPAGGGAQPQATYTHYSSYQAFSNTPALTNVSGQDNVWVLTFTDARPALAQAAASIKQTYNKSAQAQASITLGSRVVFAQSQADIKQTYNKHAQAQTTLILVKQVYAQAQAQIKVPVKVFAQAQAQIIGSGKGYAQATADILTTSNKFAQAQATLATRYWQPAQANAMVRGIGKKQAQAQAYINDRKPHAQAQAQIRNGDKVFAQAQAKLIRPRRVFAQAQATIRSPMRGYGQAMALVNQKFARAQAQAKIANSYTKSAQAQAYIVKTMGFAQARVVVVYPVLYDTFSTNTSTGTMSTPDYGPTWDDWSGNVTIQGRINGGELLVDHTVTAFPVAAFTSAITPANTNTYIIFRFDTINDDNYLEVDLRSNGNGGGAGDIYFWYEDQDHWGIDALSGLYTPVGTISATYALTANVKYAARLILIEDYFAVTVWPADQAEPSINLLEGRINGTIPSNFTEMAFWISTDAVSDGYIETILVQKIPRQSNAQAQAVIKRTARGHAQAQAGIARSVRGYAQAQAFFKGTYSALAQAKCYVLKPSRAAQAQAQIISHPNRSAQAQTLITRTQGYAQAVAAIIGDAGLINDSQVQYPVNYNGYYLPGYAQSESNTSSIRIQAREGTYLDGSLSEYLGLENKTMSLRFKVVGSDYSELKNATQRAATILRSKRGISRLYVNSTDAYYLGVPKAITVESEAQVVTRALDYSVEFDLKPWLISTETITISGAGSIDTGPRSLSEGGWTPAIVTVTGTDITVSGYTETETFAGYFAVSGAVTNLVIDTEGYTATIAGVNKNALMRNLDYGMYVGPQRTYFAVSGATSITIRYQNRWY